MEQKRSIATILTRFLIALALVTNISVLGAIFILEKSASQEQITQTFDELSLYLRSSLLSPLWHLDYTTISQICASLRLSKAVAYVSVTRNDGKQLCRVSSESGSDDTVERQFEIDKDGQVIGTGGLSLLCRCRDMLMADDDRKAIGEFGDRPVIGFWACEEPKDQRRPLDAFLC